MEVDSLGNPPVNPVKAVQSSPYTMVIQVTWRIYLENLSVRFDFFILQFYQLCGAMQGRRWGLRGTDVATRIYLLKRTKYFHDYERKK